MPLFLDNLKIKLNKNTINFLGKLSLMDLYLPASLTLSYPRVNQFTAQLYLGLNYLMADLLDNKSTLNAQVYMRS